MDRSSGVLAGLLGRSDVLLPAGRREWAEAGLAEAAEVPTTATQLAPTMRRMPSRLER